ncbi:LysR family transcriptional regulator [Georgenia alba]|uniref:LysR family transcriptional regulator n=1 Tax=Georgenia alba TaxID=2233858 RepID=A0ABW2QCQ4_9MICO
MGLDLNLLRVLVAVIEEGTLTAAAERLHVTQPSVSHSLRRLRRATHDDLFVKKGRLVQPTRVALELYAQFGDIPRRLDDAFGRAAVFDPSSSDRVFRVGLTDLGEITVLSPLVRQLQQRAPRTGVEVMRVQIDTLEDQLATGQLDVAVASWKPEGRLASIPMRQETYVCIAQRGMFGADGPTVEEVERTPRAQVSPSTGHVTPSYLWESTPPGSATVQSFAAIPPLLASNRMLSVVPSIVAPDWTERWPLESWTLPVELPDVIVYCHVRAGPLQPAQRWFMRQVMEAAHSAWE